MRTLIKNELPSVYVMSFAKRILPWTLFISLLLVHGGEVPDPPRSYDYLGPFPCGKAEIGVDVLHEATPGQE
jgi:hypothetical protein